MNYLPGAWSLKKTGIPPGSGSKPPNSPNLPRAVAMIFMGAMGARSRICALGEVRDRSIIGS